MFIIGLTGGIGTGKTEVAELLRKFGAEVINADLIGHEIYVSGTPVWDDLVDEFGSRILNKIGEIDRCKLGDMVFSNPRALRRLNSITHPRILGTVQKCLRNFENKQSEVVVVEAAILLDAGWVDMVDEIWVVVAEELDIAARVSSTRNLSEQQIKARIRSQMDQTKLISLADAVIYNNGDLHDLQNEVRSIWKSRIDQN